MMFLQARFFEGDFWVAADRCGRLASRRRLWKSMTQADRSGFASQTLPSKTPGIVTG